MEESHQRSEKFVREQQIWWSLPCHGKTPLQGFADNFPCFHKISTVNPFVYNNYEITYPSAPKVPVKTVAAEFLAARSAYKR